MKYTTWGSVRGGCGHLHRTLGAAEACRIADSRDCKRAGGYSDRLMYAVESRSDIGAHRPRGPVVFALGQSDR